MSEHGSPVAYVQVEIDYAILQHFSQHLYSSPNKAVEELVTNGYDALATKVNIYLPGTSARDCVLVWDDGDSMDLDGIRQLWWIARSPKNDGSARVARSVTRGIERAMIGKFGIGKLASYALGDRISHLCHRDNKYYLIAVSYGEAPKVNPGEAAPPKGFQVPVMELSEESAKAFAKSLYRTIPGNFSEIWAQPSWTLAVIDELKDEINLTPGRLRWVLGNGMPSRPDFKAYVNQVVVTPKVEQGALVTWDASDKVVKERLRGEWDEAKKSGRVQGDIKFAKKGDSHVVTMPSLGDVRLQVKLYDRSLFQKDRSESGRSEGFFVMVRDRLLNPDDPKLFLHDPSYGAFNRMQIFIWADGLDSDLLADRERLHRLAPTGVELEILQIALYRAGRNKLTATESHARLESRVAELPIIAREYLRDPLTALIMNEPGGDLTAVNPGQTRMTIEANGTNGPLSKLDVAGNRIVTNVDHPMYVTMLETFGRSRRSQEAQKLVEMFAVADLLLKGRLLDLGVDIDIVDNVMKWREAQLRSLQAGFKQSPDLVIKEVIDTSFKGHKPFEQALAKLFQLMGFYAEIDGASGQKDVLVIAPVGEEERRFTVEAKGSKKALSNDDAEISGAAAHAIEVGALFSVVVAREFAGFSRQADGSEPAILKECRAQGVGVSIITVDALVDLYEAVKRHQYSLPMIAETLAEICSPEEKKQRIAEMRNPVAANFDWRDVFDELWSMQQGTASQEPVSTLALRQARPEWKAMSRESFDQVLVGLDSLSGGLLKVNTSQHTVNLLQAPEMVASKIAASVEGSSGADKNS
ncbi:ATP-binding protein [Saccharothrix tamanrassetensis]|uniref:ATP-binding protein n=1 Tax=Saccharothrix tamanrassetensis TaxID=1051531 RepID=UPI0028AEC66C|nr:ATP-binding protein [Saccharothrix tamanrassetensis]